MNKSDLIAELLAEKKRLDWTVYKIAQASGLTTTTVDRILNSKTGNPNIENLLKIAGGMGKKIALLPMNFREKQEFEKSRRKS